MINRSSKEAHHEPTHRTFDDNDKYVRHGINVKRIRCVVISVMIMICLMALRLAIFLDKNNDTGLRPATLSIPEIQPIPQCKLQPWKPNEDMRGKCPGDLKPFAYAKTISDCASTCCSNPKCITWQHKEDTGCLQGGDVRLGMERG